MLDAPAPSSTKRKQSKCIQICVLPRVGLRSRQRPRTWEYRKVTIAASSPEFYRAIDTVDHLGQAMPTLPTVSLQTTSEDNKIMWTLKWSIMPESKSGDSLAYAGVWYLRILSQYLSPSTASTTLDVIHGEDGFRAVPAHLTLRITFQNYHTSVRAALLRSIFMTYWQMTSRASRQALSA
ncbi:hypothetical protein BDP81DRAFT_437732 [Colletotrichum phormii]|uniref:Uncharacterized protein n=1 Tax=Colletotrichum phormii TaxID=359342 RepID=A0AAJ0EB05_9PEZI|nr:uncharacterized protein BDP81DRAFT_437732 [Colletotrichum phormii]KAK1624525.1 hypothetical protein BDP81DRAFT_437732 [Colletotrichum phormii]